MRHRVPFLILAFVSNALNPWFALSAGEPPKDAPPHVHVSSKREMEIIRGPKSGDDRARWLQEQRRWREEFNCSIGFETTEYDRPELAWRLRDFVQTMLMVEDRYFYDPVAARYTVDRYLDDLESRYGGVDSVILWAIYPNIGVDHRNQFDLLRDLPGGPAALRGVIADFHRRSVRVFLPIMPWDIGTRDEGRSLAETVVALARDLGADGVFGDTVRGFTRDYVQTARSLGCPLVFEHESTMVEEDRLSWGTMSWGYWLYGPEPVLSKYKWVEPRHKVHVCERWAKDRTDQLQSAFFNGVGYETWENIWGIWNPLNSRDAAVVRRMAAIERSMTDLLIGADWEPFATTGATGIHASKFPGAGQALWLLVNRTADDLQAALPIAPRAPSARYFDLWNGREISPRAAERGVVLSFPIEAWGFGAVLAADATRVPPGIDALLEASARLAGTPLGPRRGEAPPLRQTIVPIVRTAPVSAAPDGMVRIPAGRFRFRVSGVEIEGGDKPGVDVQYPWEDAPRRHHDKVIAIDAFYIDRHPVTTAQFRRFLDHSGYRPCDAHNFLRDWIDGAPPAGWEKKPVTRVSLEDARAYAAWAGKRLPHEWEWQYAAQGTDERDHPWGSGANPLAVPAASHTRELPPPTDVDSHPQGASPFGVEDMTGNIWQWTDEFTDEHTRAAIIRGGCAYRPDGSKWYFPTNSTLREHGKYLLMAPSRDRAGTVGFRCAVDAAATTRADAPATSGCAHLLVGSPSAPLRPNAISVVTDVQGYGTRR